MKILAIETSCDETAVSILEIQASTFKIISNLVSSQIKIHAKYGGIVPEVAARKHAENIIPALHEVLECLKYPRKSASTPTFSPYFANGEIGGVRGGEKNPRLSASIKIDVIAVTNGPGLITSLRVGVEAAKTLAYVWKKPLIPVNHVIGHIYANWLMPSPTSPPPPSGRGRIKEGVGIEFPALCLVVSGGHTMLILMKGHGKFEIIGQTLDDAAGECFDKTAKILGLGYPGGPAIAERARQWKSEIRNPKSETNSNDRNSKFKTTPTFSPCSDRSVGIGGVRGGLPRPMINSNDFNFSFSGLKTAVLYKMRAHSPVIATPPFVIPRLDRGIHKKSTLDSRFSPFGRPPVGWRGNDKKTMNDFITQMAYEIQNAIVDVLVSKTIRAAKFYKVKTILLGGGVAANQELRKRFQSVIPTLTESPSHPVIPRSASDEESHAQQNEISPLLRLKVGVGRNDEDSRTTNQQPSTTNQQPSTTNQQPKLFMPDLKYCTDNAAMIAIAAYFNPKKVRWDKIEADPNLKI